MPPEKLRSSTKLVPQAQKKLRAVSGFYFCGLRVGIKNKNPDFAALYSEVPCRAAAVFTRNKLPGAPIIIGKKHIKDGALQALVINSKNANVHTGKRGERDALAMCRALAKSLKIKTELVLPSSTGIIGQYLPLEKIKQGCRLVPQVLGSEPIFQAAFAKAILTTDRVIKYSSITLTTKQGKKSTLLGIAKGAGMIEPQLATMLAYFVTDAEVSLPTLRKSLKKATDLSFNSISIDSDTSTSDSVVLMANGKAGAVAAAPFEAALTQVAISLAKQIVSDAEGTERILEVRVKNAKTAALARKVGKSLINSPLIKTALHGGDPNWGRFVMAIGKVFDLKVAPEKLKISLLGKGRERVSHQGTRAMPLEKLKRFKKLFSQPVVQAEIDLQQGREAWTVWGCDLSKEYIEKNAFYST